MTDPEANLVDAITLADAFNLIPVLNAVTFARVRLLSTSDLIDGLANPELPGDYSLIKVLRERKLTDTDRAHLADVVEGCLSDDFRIQVPTRRRGRLSRLLPHVAGLLDEARAHEIARRLTLHRLTTIRAGAMKTLRRLSPSSDDVAVLRSALDEYREIDAVFLLARIPDSLTGYTCCQLAPIAERGGDSYYGAIVIERLARDNALDHTHAAHEHPFYYLRAVGRLGDRGLLKHVRDRIPIEDPEFLSLAASVAGRVGDAHLITLVETRVREMLANGSWEYHALLDLLRRFPGQIDQTITNTLPSSDA